jgi:hypothetical protein
MDDPEGGEEEGSEDGDDEGCADSIEKVPGKVSPPA